MRYPQMRDALEQVRADSEALQAAANYAWSVFGCMARLVPVVEHSS